MKSLLIAMVVLLLPAIVQGQDLKDVKCVVNPKMAAKADMKAKYMDGEVYFCCGACKAKFEADPAKYTAAANYQLATTGQYEQVACPFSGGEIDNGQAAKVGEMEVGLCCGNCKAKVEGAKDKTAQIDMLFSKKAFGKGYKPVKSEDIDLSKARCPMMDDEVSAEYAADYRGGKVYFCCKRCVAAFEKNPEKYATAANAQLVVTGQFQQTACPFSGGPLADGTSVKLGDEELSFCCGNCKGKVEGAADDEARMQMVYSNKAFEKGFAKAGASK
ncbi:MAG: YHS domain-containing protein [Planctomycetaceae bacterium]|nr:YHS domain-containing protein [Planctomycetaceae bacterium]MCP4463536.1 YHS domain-containing protein [Planctomycetaceae bacterium]